MDEHLNIWNIFFNTFLDIFLPWAVITTIFSCFLFLFLQQISGKKSGTHGCLIFGFCSLGGVVGIISGGSLTSVMGAVIPALLTFISAILAYMFGKETLAKWRDTIPFCLVGMLVCAIYMVFVGSGIKGEQKKYEKDYEVWLLEKKSHIKINEELLLTQIKNGKIIKIAEPERPKK